MSKVKSYVQRKAIERVPGPAMDLVGKAVLRAVDKAVEDRWDRALKVVAEAEGATLDQRVDSIHKRFRRELTAMGAASGAVAAAPGLGTGVAVGALMADLGWFAMRATDLIMAIGAANGYVDSTADERRAWVLSILAYGEEAAEQFTNLLIEMDAGVAIGGQQVSTRMAGLVGGDAAKLDALRRINTNLATTVVSKYGSRRSILAVGKLLPFGVGAVVGGTANYALTRVVGSQAAKFFVGYRSRVSPPPPSPGQAMLAPLPSGELGSGDPGGPSHRSASVDTAEPTASTGEGHPPPPPEWPRPAPPPPVSGNKRLPNPPASLSEADRNNSIPTDTSIDTDTDTDTDTGDG